MKWLRAVGTVVGLAAIGLLAASLMRPHHRHTAGGRQPRPQVVSVPSRREVPTEIGAVTGQVVRADTGMPVEGATVVLANSGSGHPPETVTDAQGHYTFGVVPTGRAAVIAKAEELGLALAGCANIEIEPGATAQARSIRLERGGWVCGRVILAEPTQATAEWGSVSARLVGDEVRHISVGTTMDADGTFRTLCLPPGTYRLTAKVSVRPSSAAAGAPREWTGEADNVVVEAGDEVKDTATMVEPPAAR